MALTTTGILQPEILKIGRRRYRKIPQIKALAEKKEDEQNYVASYMEEDLYYYDEAESCVNEYDAVPITDDGRYRNVLKGISSCYYKFMAGKNGQTWKNIESQTKTSIKLPRKGCEGDIEITGKDRSGVLAASTKIKTLIEISRGEQQADHFLSIPLISSQLVQQFENFKREVLKIKARGIDPSIFQLPERLHLTICTMTFVNVEEIQQNMKSISETVYALQTKYLNIGTLRLRLQGIEYMNDDPGEVDVLYAKISSPDVDSDRLQAFVDELTASLVSRGFAKKDYNSVKLHVTVMNTLFRITDGNLQQEKSQRKKREAFDATQILETFNNFDFGVVVIQTIEISMRRKFSKDGYYERVGFITF